MLRKYEMVWRTNYEAYAAGAWLLCLGTLVFMWQWVSMPTQPFLLLGAFACLFAIYNSTRAWRLWTIVFMLSGKGIAFISDKELFEKIRKRPGSLWVGKGFDWGPVHTQRLYEIKRANPKAIMPPRLVMWLQQRLSGEQVAALNPDYIGAPWIHGLEPNEIDLYVPFQHFIGNTLILGINRCGKTRLLELIAEMAISLGYTVICLDPKGDQPFEESLAAACKATGRAKDFVRFHLAFPRSSVRLDMLKNYTNPSDLPSRISALMGGGDDNSSFRDFAWSVLNSIVLGELEIGEKPTLVRLRSYVENGVADLLLRVLLSYFEKKLPQSWENDVTEFAKSVKKGKSGKGRGGAGGEEEGDVDVRQSLNLLLAYYFGVLKPTGQHHNEAIEALGTIYKHDAAHYSKMIANLIPILAMLTTGELGPLLSPDPRDLSDERPMTDWQSLIESNSVVYCGLDSLSNKAISSAVGSLALSDLTAVAASIYNYAPEKAEKNKVVLIVDETSEVVNDPFISLLNKAPGAGFVIFSAIQTVPDLSARFGSMDKARQMLGNFNNMFAMRLKDKVTLEFVVETFAETYVQNKQVIHTNATATKTNVAHFTGSIQERVTDTLEEMIPPDTFVKMPNWQGYGSVSGGRIIKFRLPIIQHAHS